MIKLVSMGSMKYIKEYSTLMEAEKDLKLKNEEKYLVDYKGQLYTIGRFLKEIKINVDK
jgi:hypothetical protein|nr:MAG TPA: hypothetical protein [Caudoviricetes sp.]